MDNMHVDDNGDLIINPHHLSAVSKILEADRCILRRLSNGEYTQNHRCSMVHGLPSLRLWLFAAQVQP